MLRRILFITLFLIPTLFSVAQNQVKTISGELIDQEMKEAVVTGRAAQVVVHKDTLIYSPEAYRTPEGSAIEELIKRMPGADIDEDGNITMNGKTDTEGRYDKKWGNADSRNR